MMKFKMKLRPLLLACGLASAVWGQEATEPKFSQQQLDFFESKVRPLLVEHCFECHSDSAKKLQAGLRLDTRALAIKGGESGAAVIPQKPAESLLIQAVRWESLEMPPKGKLADREIAILTKWIEIGIPWPATSQPVVKPVTSGGYDWNEWSRSYWAFQPVAKPEPPNVDRSDWPKSDVDRFVMARLEAAGVQPAPPAPPRTLVRRIYLDLIGLPPTPNQVDSFLTAFEKDSQAAILELVDQLLDSQHYGERWGRHWLDVARYSDGLGGFLDNAALNHAWRYRDWVVHAFNRDLRFDEFVKLQIAGDLLGNDGDGVATGFFSLGPTYRSDGGDPDSVAQAKAETLSDRLDTLGRGMLGLTLACARCHDHKFDPIPQQDYYSLAGVFNNTATHELPLASADVVQAYRQHQASIQRVDKQIKKLNGDIKKQKRKPTDNEQRELDRWNKELAELKKNAPKKFDVAHSLREAGSADMKVAIRGNPRKLGETAPRRFLRILSNSKRPGFQSGSGRKELAIAVASPNNPLTARVFVNRSWMHHFGKALVRSPGNFGATGQTPTHPQLLDWLTASFIESGYSVKQMHRTVMLSATYQMSSDFNEQAFQIDGDNRLLWRMNPRRLDVESFRDSLLSVTDELDAAIGGPPIDRVESLRRTLYFKVSRNGDVFSTDALLRLFDFPLMRATVDQRVTSIVPQQYLFLMNNEFVIQRAKKFAAKMAVAAETDAARIGFAYEVLYQRPAEAAEVAIGLEFLANSEPADQGLSRWDRYAQVLLCTNEFMFVR